MRYTRIKDAVGRGALSIGLRSAPASLLALCISGALAVPAVAQESSVTRRMFSIPPQPLDTALRSFSEQSQQQVLFSESVVVGRRSPALKGVYSPQEALRRLLEGSGVEISTSSPGVYALKQRSTLPPRSSDAQRTLDTVNVRAEAEKRNSYTADELSLGSMGQSLRQTPQSVSVITRQQLDDRNLTTLDEAIAQTTGVTKTARNFGNHKFSIRSFTVDNSNYLVDGVAGIIYAPVGWLPIDTAVLERVEVLRGAGGMMLGAADPSGAINMVRNRPQDQAHLDVAMTLASWDNYRAEVDGGGPLNATGTVRGRVVAAYHDRHSFQDGISSKAPVAYGVIDADLTPDTTVTLGVRHQASDTDGYWLFGLPRYSDGGALDVKRSTSLIQKWNRQEGSVDEAFAEAETRISEDWSARLSVSRTESDLDQRVAVPLGAVDRITGVGSRFYDVYFNRTRVRSDGIDLHALGSFEAFGLTHQVLVGAMWSSQRTRQSSADLDVDVPINVYAPDHSSLPQPEQPSWDWTDHSREKRSGIYSNLRLQLATPLHLTLGGRLSWLSYETRDAVSGVKSSDYEQKHEFTPYAGLVYDFSAHWSAYASYADTFEPQSAYVTVDGSALDPAIGANYEAGVKGELGDGGLNVSAAIFAVRKSGGAVVDEANPGSCRGSLASSDCYRNGGTLRSKGFELEASGELLPGWELMAGYTHVTSRDDEGATISAETPRHLLRLNTSYQLPGKWSDITVGGGVSAQSSYSYPAYDDTRWRMGAAGRAIWDLRASYRLSARWTVGVNVANLFDKRYYAMISQIRRGNYLGEPRNVMLTLRGSL